MRDLTLPCQWTKASELHQEDRPWLAVFMTAYTVKPHLIVMQFCGTKVTRLQWGCLIKLHISNQLRMTGDRQEGRLSRQESCNDCLSDSYFNARLARCNVGWSLAARINLWDMRELRGEELLCQAVVRGKTLGPMGPPVIEPIFQEKEKVVWTGSGFAPLVWKDSEKVAASQQAIHVM